MFVETEERLVSRRQEENRFFLSINAVVVTVVSVVLSQGISDQQASAGILLLSLAGAALCWAWYEIVESYQVLNSAKFDVIEQFEMQLPARMFGSEWDSALSRNYSPFTRIEKRVPMIFGAVHGLATIVGILGLIGVLQSG